MRRDYDLIRFILLEVEEKCDGKRPLEIDLSASGYSAEQVSYHVRQLHEAGYVRGQIVGGRIGPEPERCVVFALTGSGHDFLESIRSDTVWNTIKAKLQSNGLTVAHPQETGYQDWRVCASRHPQETGYQDWRVCASVDLFAVLPLGLEASDVSGSGRFERSFFRRTFLDRINAWATSSGVASP